MNLSPATTQEMPIWLERFVLPALFTLLGACIGFGFTWLRDAMEAHRAKAAFLRAVKAELLGIRNQVANSIAEVGDSLEKAKTAGHVPQFNIPFHATVFRTQLGKLRELDDPLVFTVVSIYSDLDSIVGMVELVNRTCMEAVKASQVAGPPAWPAKVTTACERLLERLNAFEQSVNRLIHRLPTT